MKYNEIYENSLVDAQKKYIENSTFSTKPLMTTGIISPESTICIQPELGIEFELDKEGMSEVIEMLENIWASRTEKEKKNLLSILSDVYSVTEVYLGGHGIPEKRENAYIKAKNNRLSLSEIKGKNIGLCAERAAIGHQLLTILEKAGFIWEFESFLTLSHMAVDTLVPHAFIVLKNKKDSSKQYIFDIENLIEYKKNDSSELVPAIALYPLTEEEFEDFKEGKSLSPQCIHEQFGLSVVGPKKYYGDEIHYDDENYEDESQENNNPKVYVKKDNKDN